jgi:hypothetical protein
MRKYVFSSTLTAADLRLVSVTERRNGVITRPPSGGS